MKPKKLANELNKEKECVDFDLSLIFDGLMMLIRLKLFKKFKGETFKS